MDQTLPTTHAYNLKKLAPFIITGIILLGGVVFALLKINNNPDSYEFPSITSQDSNKEVPQYVVEEGESLLFSYAVSDTGNSVDLFIEPQQPIDNLITFGLDLQVAVDSSSPASQYKVALEPAFSEAGWSLIVNDVSMEDSIRVQLAGIRGDATPYPVSDRIHVATLSLPTTVDAQDVQVLVAPKLSEAFDKQMTVYKIISAQESAEL
jgi:hypothetical protein